VERMLTVMGAIFVEFQLFLDIASIFTGRVIASFALTALKSYQFNCRLFACHNKPL